MPRRRPLRRHWGQRLGRKSYRQPRRRTGDLLATGVVGGGGLVERERADAAKVGELVVELRHRRAARLWCGYVVRCRGLGLGSLSALSARELVSEVAGVRPPAGWWRLT